MVAEHEDRFKLYACRIHHKYGRLISWLAFGVGTEYLVRGSFMLKEYDPIEKKKKVITLPEENTNIEEWIHKVKQKNASVCGPGDRSLMTLGDSKLPWD